ncbi:MAG: 2-amino-4-hydroxy-6-hydroxymethyldihydropteridine diphosphokinase [Pseudomonadota bacterium]
MSHSSFNNIAYIGLGSNLGESLTLLTQATSTIASHPDITLQQCSSWYQNPALTLSENPLQSTPPNDYLNGVIKLSTRLSPIELLDTLQDIEQQYGRVRTEVRWEDRTLDLDILLYNNKTFSSERLTLPHSQLHTRAFVLYPLHEIEPHLTLPDGQKLNNLIHQVSNKELEKIDVSS